MAASHDDKASRLPSLLELLEYLYPIVLLVTFISAAAAHSIITARDEEELEVPAVRGPGGKPLPVTKKRRAQHERKPVRDFSLLVKRVFQYVMAAITFTFVADGIAITLHVLADRVEEKGTSWWCGEPRVIYVTGSAFLYLYFFLSLFDWKPSPNIVHFSAWCLGWVGELVILISLVVRQRAEGGVWSDVSTEKHGTPTGVLDTWDVMDLVIASVRTGLLFGLIILYATLTLARIRRNDSRLEVESQGSDDADEQAPLLNGSRRGYQTQNGNGHAHVDGSSSNGRRRSSTGTPDGAADECFDKIDHAGYFRPDKLPHKTWWEYLRGYSLFLPYLWPSKNLQLQLTVLVCFVLLILQRVVNILVPYQIGVVTNMLSEPPEKLTMPWLSLSLLIIYKLLQGPSGLLGSVRALLWIPVSQYSYRALTTAAFEHVHSLSLDFHLGKRTGEVLSALNKGASINNFLEQVTFQVFPMLIDLFVAITYFQIAFDSTYAIIVSIITFYYLFLTIQMAATRSDQRRAMVNADREEVAVKNDSITSYETVKYFNAEAFEFNRYRNAIKTFQVAEAQVTWGMNLMNVAQACVFMCGMLVAMMLGAWQVSAGTRSVGDFVTLITYLGQLQGPLNFFGTFYRTVQQAMISGERLLELFKIRPTVVDKPGVKTLPKCDGHIQWSKVGFSYEKQRTALREMSFECAPGTTTAFVGESGGGKSTIFRLMFRYYNCQDGRILVDGQDVKDLTIDSVRRHIGVVPQDTILFNESLMYNLRYANQDASDDEIFEACRAASIHDRILSFPDGYDTRVGERGLRLSGGEKQRVAIARTILKRPKIIMLDEATSALDTQTEQLIQEKLFSLGQGRTLMVIAHRLSTITHADQIIVLHQGTIVEKGTHDELLAKNGRYASMWEKQSRAEEAAEQARRAQKRAVKLLRKADIGHVPKKDQVQTPGSDGYNSMSSSAFLQGTTPTPGSPSRQNASSDDESSSETAVRPTLPLADGKQ